MSLNFERLHEIINQAYAENSSVLTQIMANPLLNPSLHFLKGVPFLFFYFFVNILNFFNSLGYPALERLFLASNQISRVSLQALADMPSLVELDLSDNKLIADAIDGPIFDLPNLKILNLSHNKLAILNDQLLTTLNR